MRVINVSTYTFEEFYDTKTLNYAILSHTWRDNELLYTDVLAGINVNQLHKKLNYLCRQARGDGIQYVWIDTACIDKSSSAELSEAINSMYQWYKDATICYVWLDDVHQLEDIKICRWITRGWTLQELIAPSNVRFYSSDWTLLGTKRTLARHLAIFTGIDHVVLRNNDHLMQMSVATRMSWAANRNTTRIEDQAYCLLGIFGVNMPLLYGERNAAFKRLQEEIIRQSDDQSILAWHRGSDGDSVGDVLASSPSDFQDLKIISIEGPGSSLEHAKGGLRLSLQLYPGEIQDAGIDTDPRFGILTCRLQGDLNQQVAIAICRKEASTTWQIDAEYYIWRQSAGLVTVKSQPSMALEEIILTQSQPSSSRLLSTRSHLTAYRNVCIIESNSLAGLDVIYHDSVSGSFHQPSFVAEVITREETVIRTYFFFDRARNDGFMIQLRDVALRLHKREILYLAHVNAFLQILPKPSGKDFYEWMQAQVVILEGHQLDHSHNNAQYWISRPPLALYSSTELQNTLFATRITAKAFPVEIAASPNIAAWKIMISIDPTSTTL